MSSYADDTVTVHHGDCLDVLATLPDASTDAVVTDPPYGLEFMGKDWDSFGAGRARIGRGGDTARSGVRGEWVSARPQAYIAGHAFQAWCELWAEQCLRVLKPGGHLLAFGGTRTSHRLACAVEDAGFEIRDSIAWLYGSGFPKSLDVSKAIDKRAEENVETKRRIALVAEVIRSHREAKGMERAEVSHAVVGTPSGACWNWEHHQLPSVEMWPTIKATLDIPDKFDGLIEGDRAQFIAAEREVLGLGGRSGRIRNSMAGDFAGEWDATAPASDAARTWQGWGTALKPAHEPIVVARKPLSGTVAANVLTHGVGALNIDGCRVGEEGGTTGTFDGTQSSGVFAGNDGRIGGTPTGGVVGIAAGRWPANVVLDEDQAAALDQQSGESVSTTHSRGQGLRDGGVFGGPGALIPEVRGPDDAGGASRFFYIAKADAKERVRLPTADGTSPNAANRRCATCKRSEITGTRCECPEPQWERETPGHVSHPTVKPLALMRWLVRLVTPPGGTVLEPFAGSGTTVEACILEGFRCVAVEREADYLPLILQRIHRRRDPVAAVKATAEDGGLFDLLGEEDEPA